MDQESVCNPYSNISTITSPRLQREFINASHITPDDIEEVIKELSEIQSQYPTSQIADLSTFTIGHIAAIIENKMLNFTKYSCEHRKDLLEYNEKVTQVNITPEEHAKALSKHAELQNIF